MFQNERRSCSQSPLRIGSHLSCLSRGAAVPPKAMLAIRTFIHCVPYVTVQCPTRVFRRGRRNIGVEDGVSVATRPRHVGLVTNEGDSILPGVERPRENGW